MALSVIVDQNFSKQKRKELNKQANLDAYIQSLEKTQEYRRTYAHSPISARSEDETVN